MSARMSFAKRHKTGITAFLIGCSIAVVMIISAHKWARTDTSRSPREIVPTVEQQQPIKDMLAEQRKSAEQYQAQISGAIRMLMAQTKDPETGKSLDTTKWTAQSDGKDGIKFIEITTTPPGGIQPPQQVPNGQ